MTEWVRLWHDMPTDPKWRAIARKSGQRIGDVIALFNLLMVNASGNADARGTLVNWDNEDAGAALDMEAEDVAAIMAAMQGKVLDGDRLTGWEKRQVACGHGGADPEGKSYLYVIGNSASRQVKIGTSRNPWSRAKDLQSVATGKTTVVATFSGVRSDESEVHRLLADFRKGGEWFDLPDKVFQFLIASHDARMAAKPMIAELRELLASNYRSYEDTDTDTDNSVSKETADIASQVFSHGVALIVRSGKPEHQARAFLGKMRKAHGDPDLIAAIGAAQRQGAIDPVSFIHAALRQRARDGPDVDRALMPA